MQIIANEISLCNWACCLGSALQLFQGRTGRSGQESVSTKTTKSKRATKKIMVLHHSTILYLKLAWSEEGFVTLWLTRNRCAKFDWQTRYPRCSPHFCWVVFMEFHVREAVLYRTVAKVHTVGVEISNFVKKWTLKEISIFLALICSFIIFGGHTLLKNGHRSVHWLKKRLLFYRQFGCHSYQGIKGGRNSIMHNFKLGLVEECCSEFTG